MGSRGGAAGGGSGGTLDPKTQALPRQGSIYNLTLDEFQHQLGDLGKPLSSMNLGELLKSIWTAESGNVGFAPLSRDMSKKTVDEVWRDIQQGQNGDNTNKRVNRGEEQTLEDITLEDFLVQAGVFSESSVRDESLFLQESVPRQPQWMPYSQNQHNNVMGVYMPGGNQIVEAGYPEPHMSMSPSALMGAISGTQTPGRKRLAYEDVGEKTVERRQKRMIKNRESAARSRERKQAYTHELENKISRLEEENDRLRRLKEVEKILPSSPAEPKYQLRRTSSASL